MDVSASSAWDAFTDLLDLTTSMVSTVTQTYMILGATRSTGGGLLFAMICCCRSLIEMGAVRMLWTKSSSPKTPDLLTTNLSVPAYAVYVNNTHYIRMLSMKDLASEAYRQDIISGNFVDYILSGT